jgi:hypothetical protein
MFDDPQIDKIIIFALLGIILVLIIAVILLAIKKNTYYVDDRGRELEPVRTRRRPARPVYEDEEDEAEEKDEEPAYTRVIPSTRPAPAQENETDTSIPIPPVKKETPAESAVRSCTISITVGSQTAVREINAFPCLLGREADVCNVVIPEPAVSRKHAKLILHEGQLWLEDVSGHNGTFINGEKLPSLGKEKLKEGDKIQLGRAVVVVQKITR